MEKSLICPGCEGTALIKWGQGGGGRQKYRCRNCGRQFVAGADHFIDPAIKGAAMRLIDAGVPTKKIATSLGISRRWISELKRRMTDARR